MESFILEIIANVSVFMLQIWWMMTQSVNKSVNQCSHDSIFTSGPVSIKTEIPNFCPNQGSSTHNNEDNLDSISTMFVLSKKRCPTLKIGHLVFDRKRLETRVLSWQRSNICHFASLWCTCLKFEDRPYNISKDLFDPLWGDPCWHHCLHFCSFAYGFTYRRKHVRYKLTPGS